MISFNSRVCGSGLMWPAVLSASFWLRATPPAATLVVVIVVVVVAVVVIVVVVVVVVAVGLLQSVAVHVSIAAQAPLLRDGGHRNVGHIRAANWRCTHTHALVGVVEEIRGVLWSKKSGVCVC